MKLSKFTILAFLLTIVMLVIGCQAAQQPDPTNFNRTSNGFPNTGMPNEFNNFDRIRYDNMNPLNGGMSGLNRGGMLGTNNPTNQLERRIEQINGVNNATVVAEGNTCYVGLDMDNNFNSSNRFNGQNRMGLNGNGPNDRLGDLGRTNKFGQIGNLGNRNNTGQQGIMNGTDNRMQIDQVRAQVEQIVLQDKRFKNVVVSDDRDFGQRLGDIANQINAGRPIEEFGDMLRDLGRTIMPTRAR